MADHLITPAHWEEQLYETLDFEAAFSGLEGYEHFHTDMLRGYMRSLQLRPEEAIEWYDRAESKYENPDNDPEDFNRFFLMLANRLQVRFFQEVQDPTLENQLNTDREMEKILENGSVETPITTQLLIRAQAAYHLLRADFNKALELYNHHLESSRNTPAFQLYSYAGAAAAAHELGQKKQCRRHYENLELSMSFASSRLVFYLTTAWLKALCGHWGWEGEARRWTETIEALECCDASKALLRKRADILGAACRPGAVTPIA